MTLSRREFLKGSSVALASTAAAKPSLAQSISIDDLLTMPWDDSALDFVRVNRDYLHSSAHNNNIPVELLMAVAYYEVSRSNFVTKAEDYVMNFFDRDATIGPMQVLISRAVMLDGKKYDELTHDEREAYEKKLAETQTSIDYAARFLRYLMNRPNRLPNANADELRNNPHAIAVIASEYHLGPRSTTLEQAKPSDYGFEILKRMYEGSPLYEAIGLKPDNLSTNIIDYIQSNGRLMIDNLKDNRTTKTDVKLGRFTAGGIFALSTLAGTGLLLKRLSHVKTK